VRVRAISIRNVNVAQKNEILAPTGCNLKKKKSKKGLTFEIGLFDVETRGVKGPDTKLQ